MNPRLEAMIDSRELEAAPAPDAEVVARWRRAVQSYADSRRDLGPESIVTLCYQAGLQAATTVVRAAGYRVRSSHSGHHRTTFEALRALDIPGLSVLGREMNDLRRTRHHAVYDWQEDENGPMGVDPDRLSAVVRQLFGLAHDWLRNEHPATAADLVAFEGE